MLEKAVEKALNTLDELALGNKENLAAIGKEKRKSTQGKSAADKRLSNNDSSFTEPKHDTRKRIAASAKVSTGKLATREIEGKQV